MGRLFQIRGNGWESKTIHELAFISTSYGNAETLEEFLAN